MKNKPSIPLLVLLLPVMFHLSTFAQAVIIAESGARLLSESGSFWVIDNGPFTLSSPNPTYPATMSNLTIEADASLTIEPLNYLSATGIFTNNAGTAGLVVKSGGSLIAYATGVLATIEHEISAGQWHLISAPISDATAEMFSGYYLQKHTESTNVYTDIVATSTPLTKMQGYALFGNASLPTATYSGTLNTDVISFSTTYSGVGKGWNLVGNPYPSSIDWDASSGWVRSNVNNATYMLANSSSWASYVGGTGVNGGTRYIASGQGFFVVATDAGTLAMDNAVRVHNATSFFKNSAVVPNLIRLEVSGNGFTDEAVVRFLPEATPQFDGEYDAYKLFGEESTAAQIYSVGNTPLAVNTLPKAKVIPVGIHVGENGTYTITATEINDFTYVSLEDTKTGVFTNLMQDSYTFSFSPVENEQRFLLHLGALAVKEKGYSVIQIYSYQKTVIIDQKEQTKGEVSIYSISGQLIVSTITSQGINKINLENPGFYIVKAVTDRNTEIKKVWID